MSGWQDISTAEPEDHKSILVVTADVPPIVGEAWWREENGELQLWWANTGPGDYYTDPISQTNQPVILWQPLPTPPMGSGDDPGKPIVDGAADQIDWKSRALSLEREEIARIVGEAMSEAWCEICDDTGHHPLDITRSNGRLFFSPRHWADLTAARLADVIIEPIAREALSPPLMGGKSDSCRAVTVSVPATTATLIGNALEPLAAYDAGLLSDYGGGNVEWWQDYLRAELGRAHDFYAEQLSPADAPGGAA